MREDQVIDAQFAPDFEGAAEIMCAVLDANLTQQETDALFRYGFGKIN